MAYQPRSGTITPGHDIRVTPEEAPVISAMLFAFAPLHKRAFGVAVGVAGAVLMSYLTLAAMFMPGGASSRLAWSGNTSQAIRSAGRA